MSILAIYDQENKCIADQIKVPSSHLAKMRGLLFYSHIPKGFAMVFERVRQIHMLFMKVPIDIVHLDTDMKVLHCQTIRPWRIGPYIRKTKWIIEAAEGTFAHIAIGDRLFFQLEGGDSPPK